MPSSALSAAPLTPVTPAASHALPALDLALPTGRGDTNVSTAGPAACSRAPRVITATPTANTAPNTGSPPSLGGHSLGTPKAGICIWLA